MCPTTGDAPVEAEADAGTATAAAAAMPSTSAPGQPRIRKPIAPRSACAARTAARLRHGEKTFICWPFLRRSRIRTTARCRRDGSLTLYWRPAAATSYLPAFE
jgi:hypothetical protein